MSTAPKLNDPDTDTLLMAKDPDLEMVGSTTNRCPVGREGKTRHLSKISLQYDIGNKGYLDENEKVMRKYDTNNDGKLDMTEINKIVQELLAVTAKQSLLKKILLGATGFLMLSFFGNFGLTWAILVITRETVITNGGLVDAHTGQMVNVQARGMTLHPEIIPGNQRKLISGGFSDVATLPMSHAEFSEAFKAATNGATVNFILDVGHDQKQSETGAIDVKGKQDYEDEEGRQCVQYKIAGKSAPYNVPFVVRCCGTANGMCTLSCSCADIKSIMIEWEGPEPSGRRLACPNDGDPVDGSMEDKDNPGTMRHVLSDTSDRRLFNGCGCQPEGDPVDGNMEDKDVPGTARQLLHELDLVSEMKQRGHDSCFGEHYKLALQAFGTHLVAVAVPQEGTNCPMVVADAGYMKGGRAPDLKEDVPTLYKHLSIIERNAVTKDDLESMFYFGDVMSLDIIIDAIQIARTSASKTSSLHGVVGNCATFILDVMTELQIDFGKKDLQTDIINYITQALMKSPDKDIIVTNIKEKITSRAMKTWIQLHDDNYILKKFAKTFFKNYKIDQLHYARFDQVE